MKLAYAPALSRLHAISLPLARAPYLVILAFYLVLRGIVLFGTMPIRGGDELVYVAGPELAGARPFVVPSLYWLLGENVRAITGAQLLISVACWLALALTVAALFSSPRLKYVSFALTLFFSASPQIAGWDITLISESFSLSMLALLAACWLRLATAPNRAVLAALVAVSFLLVFSRDTNAYLVLLTCAPLIVVAMRTRKPRYALAAVLLAAISVSSIALSTAAHRDEYPLMNVIDQRVLPSPEHTAFFVAHGMPLTPGLQRFAGAWADSYGGQVYRETELAPYRDWLHTQGQGTYIAYLLSDPLANCERAVPGSPIAFVT